VQVRTIVHQDIVFITYMYMYVGLAFWQGGGTII